MSLTQTFASREARRLAKWRTEQILEIEFACAYENPLRLSRRLSRSLLSFECSGVVRSATAVPLIRSSCESSSATSSEVFTRGRDVVDSKAVTMQAVGSLNRFGLQGNEEPDALGHLPIPAQPFRPPQQKSSRNAATIQDLLVCVQLSSGTAVAQCGVP